MKNFRKILVATDTRYEAHPIVREAAEIARQNQASLKIVDVVPELPWAMRLTMKDHEHVRELMVKEKQERLEALAGPLRTQGLAVNVQVLSGRSSVEIIREVTRAGHDLLMRVAKGKDSRRPGFFGDTGFRLLRNCPCAVWLVTPDASPEFKHVLGCLETSSEESLHAELNNRILQLASSISRYHQGRCSLLHAWSIWNESMLSSHMQPDKYAEMERTTQTQMAALLDRFLERHGLSSRDENVYLPRGEAFDVIPAFVHEKDVDLVVLGTVARTGLSGMIMGNTAEKILNRIECSVLALKPASFASPTTWES